MAASEGGILMKGDFCGCKKRIQKLDKKNMFMGKKRVKKRRGRHKRKIKT